MTDHPNARDYANKAERAEQEATEAWACADRLAEALDIALSTYKYGDDGNSPGHGHRIPGVWDLDISNGVNAGKQCVQCNQWNAARQALAAYREKRG